MDKKGQIKDHKLELFEMIVSNFDHISELAEKLTPGNVSHKGMEILGIAKRCSEFLKKKSKDF